MRQKTIKEWLATTEEDGDEDGVQAVTQAFALVREFPMRAPPCPQSRTSEPSSKGSKKAADLDGAPEKPQLCNHRIPLVCPLPRGNARDQDGLQWCLCEWRCVT